MVGKVFTSMGYMAIFMGIYNSMNLIKCNEVAVKMQQHADIQKFTNSLQSCKQNCYRQRLCEMFKAIFCY